MTTVKTVEDATNAWLKRCAREGLDNQTLKTYASQVRDHILPRKLQDDAKNPTLIKTVWGGGYLFTPDVLAE